MNRFSRGFVNQPIHCCVWIKLFTGILSFLSVEHFSTESFIVTIVFILYTPVLKRIVFVKNLTVVIFMVYTLFWVSPWSKRDIPAIIFKAIFMEPQFVLKQDKEYRSEGDDLFPKENCAFVCTSALLPFKKRAKVVIEKLTINEFRPDMFRAYVPSMGVSIAAISMNDVCLAPNP